MAEAEARDIQRRSAFGNAAGLPPSSLQMTERGDAVIREDGDAYGWMESPGGARRWVESER